MSVQALGWVFDHSPATGAARLVLLAIANHVHGAAGEWEAWPGIETLQREAGLARKRTVNDALAKLVEIGAVTRTVNGAPDGRTRADRRPNLYRIVIDNGVTCSDTRCGWCGVTRIAQRGDEPRHNGVTKNDSTGCRETSPEPEVNRNPEPEVQPALLVVDERPVTFDEFWQAFPRRREQTAAKRAWAVAVKKAPPDEIIRGARRYAAEIGDRVQFAKYPARWLRDERWNDDPEPARSSPGRPPTSDRTGESGRISL